MTHSQLLLVKIVTFLGGLYFVLEFLLPDGAISTPGQYEIATNAVSAVGASAFALGLISLFRAHGKRLLAFKKASFASFALLLGVFVMLFSSAYSWYAENNVNRKTKAFSEAVQFAEHLQKHSGESFNSLTWDQRVNLLLTRYYSNISVIANDKERFETLNKDEEVRRIIVENRQEVTRLTDIAEKGSQKFDLTKLIELQNGFLQALTNFHTKEYNETTAYKLYKFLFEDVMGSLTTAMFSLLAFFMATAAFRAFRIRSFEAFLMVASGIIVILGQIPFGIYLSEYFPAIRLWLLQTPSSAAFRAIKIGSEIAGLLLIFRMWLSLESNAKN